MATTTDTIVLTTKEAKIILDWDDGQWYVSDIDYSGGSSSTDTGTTTGGTTTTSGGVKVPEWDTSYKYATNDIVAYSGMLYVSKQAQNIGNTPDKGTFWWNPVVDLSNIDAITLEGKNLNEVMRSVLGGNTISDYYKKSEVDNIILSYFNNVNAKKLSDWTLENIKTEYNTLIEAAETRAKEYSTGYLSADGVNSFDQSLVTLFNTSIASDNVNQLGS
jgi:hypothetical protein